jgi:hypothetical protein
MPSRSTPDERECPCRPVNAQVQEGRGRDIVNPRLDEDLRDLLVHLRDELVDQLDIVLGVGDAQVAGGHVLGHLAIRGEYLLQRLADLLAVRVSDVVHLRLQLDHVLGHFLLGHDPDDGLAGGVPVAMDGEDALHGLIERHVGQGGRHVALDGGAFDDVDVRLLGEALDHVLDGGLAEVHADVGLHAPLEFRSGLLLLLLQHLGLLLLHDR